MGRADSPLKDRMVFAFGARRSGTYWLQRILEAHPDVAGVPAETHLFSHGIAPLLERFHHGARASPQVGTMYADRDVLVDAIRDFCDRVLGDFLDPGATRLLERTPLHVHAAELIGEIYPDARLVHIIRDGRDVARSLLARSWGPATAEEAAAEWRSSVMDGRAARSHPGYVEIRYEGLLASPAAAIEDLYESLGLRVTPAVVAAASDRAATPVNLGAKAAAGEPRRVLTDDEVEAFERIGGELLEELGYERSTAGRSTAASGGEARRRGAALARLIRRPGRRHRSERRRQAGRVRTSVRLMDQMLTLARQGRAEDAAELLAPDAVVTLGDGESSTEARGARAAGRLVETLRADCALRSPQVGSEVVAPGPSVAAVLTYRLEDGSRARRLLLVTAAGERLAQVALFRFPLEAPSGTDLERETAAAQANGGD